MKGFLGRFGMVAEDKEKKAIPLIEGIFEFPVPPGGESHLLGAKCRDCGYLSFPPRSMCINCQGENLDKVPLSRKGKIYTYTICRMPIPHLPAPYAIGYVDLPEGVRVFALFAGWTEENLAIGKEVEMVIEKLREDGAGNEVVTYKFRPG